MTSTSQFLGSPEPGNGMRRLVDRVRRLEASVRALRGAAPLRAAGIELDEDGMTIGTSLSVTGDLDASGSSTIGGTMRVTGDAVFEGDLAVPNGSIKNEALANPLVPDSAYNSAAEFTITTTDQTICSATVTVPSGFTKCYATALGSIFAMNSTTALDYLRARVYVDAPGQSWWGARPLTVLGPNNGSSNLSPTRIATLTGLNAGEQVTFRLVARTDFQTLQSVWNFATIDAGAVFFR